MNATRLTLTYSALAVSLVLSACSDGPNASDSSAVDKSNSTERAYYGTLEPFASEAIYFAMTDRFVDGDPSNNYPRQGGDYPTFEGKLVGPDGKTAYVGYMGGDFKGILDNAQYIADMGFTAIWLTPIVDNPDQAFAGGEPIEFGGAFRDGGKTGYHGYWGVNFYQLDEHLVSKDLDYQQLNQALKQYNLKTVLDVVANHGSPAFSMPSQQPKFGQVFDEQGQLIADHQNLAPEQLDPNNPLHQFFNQQPDILQLSDFNQDNPKVLDYLVGAYLKWIDQGADALRIDTIKHMPHSFWKQFTDRIRAEHPDIFMFAESYSFDADFIAEHTQPENGGISVLDFPGRAAMTQVFENKYPENKEADFAKLLDYLHLQDGPYANPYELTTFYDNHDMSRMNADTNGFINAHNWLFTARGIPVVYYGSEMAFMAGTNEHAGNRNYFGQERVNQAKSHPIYQALKRIANVRKNSIALQRGLQVNLEFSGNQAAFYRVYEHQGRYQTALVLLNKGEHVAEFAIDKYLSSGLWHEQLSGEQILVKQGQALERQVAPHSVEVLLFNEPHNNAELTQALDKLVR